MSMPTYLFRDVQSEFGGVYRIHFDGRIEVIKRDFGLTWEPECSEASHRQMYKWFCQRYDMTFNPDMFPLDPSEPVLPQSEIDFQK
jgi:hypothetical protein